MAYTRADIEQTWINAGGNPQYAAIAASIALAESGGNPNATGPVGEKGLWQIALSHGAMATFDPIGNARSAITLSNNGTNWRPWCTAYTDGACGTRGGAYSPTTGSPSGRLFVGTGGVSPPGNANGGSQSGGTQPVSSASLFDPTTWLHAIDVFLNNVYYGLIALTGVAVMVTGAIILMKGSAPAQAANLLRKVA